MNLTFHKEPFHIPDEWKITLWRFNFDDSSPLLPANEKAEKWDKNAKAVSADIPGIFAMQAEQLLTGYARYALLGYAPVLGLFNSNSSNFLKIEADRRDVLFVSTEEIAISKANIIEVLTHKQFGRLYPAFPYVTTMVHGGGVIPYYREVYALMRDYFKDEELTGKGVFSLPDGFPHSLRVDKGINLLSRKMGVKNNVSAFAYWHDMMRSKDHDPEHGKRASEVIELSRGRNKFKMVDVDRLSFACKHHSTMLRSGDPLIDICFDADRLDLFYRGITPDPDLMATEIGAYYAENYDEYMRGIKPMKITTA